MKKAFFSSVFVSPFFLLLVLTGCGSCNNIDKGNNDSVMKEINKEDKSKSFSLSIGVGGGFTGLKSGYTLNSDGIVSYWKQVSVAKDSVLWKVHGDSTKIDQFKNELEKTGIIDKQFKSVGNMTAYLVYETGKSVYSWSWKEDGVSGNIPENIKNWYENVIEYCSKLHN